MSSFIFRCPNRRMMVQGWAENAKGGVGEYVAYRCAACGSVHLVNPKTGKLLSEEREPGKGDRED